MKTLHVHSRRVLEIRILTWVPWRVINRAMLLLESPGDFLAFCSSEVTPSLAVAPFQHTHPSDFSCCPPIPSTLTLTPSPLDTPSYPLLPRTLNFTSSVKFLSPCQILCTWVPSFWDITLPATGIFPSENQGLPLTLAVICYL